MKPGCFGDFVAVWRLSLLFCVLFSGGAVTADESSVSSPIFVYCSVADERSIHLLSFDAESGRVARKVSLKTPGEPAALTSSADGRWLFASMRDTGQLCSFGIEPATGRLTLISTVEAGADPAQITLDRTGRYLFAAYYVAAKISVHQVDSDGRISERPVQELPTAEKAHAIVPDPSNRLVFVPHTGPNRIYQFRFEELAGRLLPGFPRFLQLPDQTGPRHLAWHPTLPIAYVDNEQGNSVTVYTLRGSSLVPGETKSTIPEDFRGQNSTAEIRVHPDGEHLFVSNRGVNSLAVFRISAGGDQLTALEQVPCEPVPRSFAIVPGGQHLLLAGEASGNLQVFEIGGVRGFLREVDKLQVGPRLWWVHAVQPAVRAR
ncbi:MAG: lactonase family protein [Planctomyces sp.]